MADTTFTEKEQTEIRSQVQAIIDAEGLTQKQVSLEAGIKYGTFTGWLAGTYAGDNDRISGEAQIWLTSREEKKRAAASVPKVPEFVKTRTTDLITEALQFAQIMPEISVIAGAPGTSKTTTAREYQRRNSNVWMSTMDPSKAGVNNALNEIAESMGTTERSPAKLASAIGRSIKSTGGLIIVDEAQHLQSVTLDMLRSIYDRYGVGIALIGNETVYTRLEGEGRRAQFAQLYSRIGIRISQSRPKSDDMCKLIAAWGVTDPDLMKFLKAIAGKPGALRSMTKVLQLATMMAAGSEEKLAIKHLKAAYKRLTPTRDLEAA